MSGMDDFIDSGMEALFGIKAKRGGPFDRGIEAAANSLGQAARDKTRVAPVQQDSHKAKTEPVMANAIERLLFPRMKHVDKHWDEYENPRKERIKAAAVDLGTNILLLGAFLDPKKHISGQDFSKDFIPALGVTESISLRKKLNRLEEEEFKKRKGQQSELHKPDATK